MIKRFGEAITFLPALVILGRREKFSMILSWPIDRRYFTRQRFVPPNKVLRAFEI